MLNPNVEEIDLADLCRKLRARFGEILVEDYLDGRTLLRDAVESIVGCSTLEAEELIDTMETMQLLWFPKNQDETHPGEGVASWHIGK